MVIDYKKIKLILYAFHSSVTPEVRLKELFAGCKYDPNNNENCNDLKFYLHLLVDEDFIECMSTNEELQQNLGFSSTNSGEWIINLSAAYRLTMIGHKAYEAMQNEAIWNKIKKPVSKLGAKGLEQIPALGIQLLQSLIL